MLKVKFDAARWPGDTLSWDELCGGEVFNYVESVDADCCFLKLSDSAVLILRDDGSTSHYTVGAADRVSRFVRMDATITVHGPAKGVR